MKIVLAGGSGQIGHLLARHFQGLQNEVVILARRAFPAPHRIALWDTKSFGAWTREIDGADVLINLTGRSVNCRYTPENRREIMDSRVDSTRVLARAIFSAKAPPRLWLQSSTATIYAHRYDAPNDETTGILGGDEPNVPDTWRFSIGVARAWEAAAQEIPLASTRIVLTRSAMVMSADGGGVFDTLLRLVRYGLGGNGGDGRQFVSWIHGDDFTRAISFLIENENLHGAVNLTSPNPLPYSDFMRALRCAWGARFGLPATKTMLEIGTFLMGTETELVLKSRRVVPQLLLENGFEFSFPAWPQAAENLCEAWRVAHHRAEKQTAKTSGTPGF